MLRNEERIAEVKYRIAYKNQYSAYCEAKRPGLRCKTAAFRF